MTHVYFVAYYAEYESGHGFGNAEIPVSGSINNINDLNHFADLVIATSDSIIDCVIINFQLLKIIENDDNEPEEQ